MGFYDLSIENRRKLVLKIEREVARDLEAEEVGRVVRYASSSDTYVRRSLYFVLGRLYRDRAETRSSIWRTLEKLSEHADEQVRQRNNWRNCSSATEPAETTEKTSLEFKEALTNLPSILRRAEFQIEFEILENGESVILRPVIGETNMKIGDKTLTFDKDGFLQEPLLWNEEVAKAIAGEEGIAEMCENHWKIVSFIRKYWEANRLAPPVRNLCQETKITIREVYKLFKSGPARGACRVAGLPKPDGCV